MTRISRVEMNHLCAEITQHADTLNLLPLGGKVLWTPGSRTNGHAPQVGVFFGRHNAERAHVSFLPEFTYRTTTREAYRELSATNKVLAVLAARER